MTNKTDRTGDRVDRDGAEVSRLYREAATERTPARLDARVLAAARRDTKTRYWAVTHWLRPMAWAATIGLCLAIVIELSTVPDEALDVPYIAQPDSTMERREPAAIEAVEMPARQDEPQPAADLEQQKDEDRAQGAPEAPAAVEEQATPEPRLSQDPGAASRLRAAPEMKGEALNEMAGFAATSALNDADASLCPQEAIAMPDKWLDCIAELESGGRDDDAARERERFERMYPDYEVD